MISTFKNSQTAGVAEGVASKSSRKLLPESLHKNAQLKLALLNRAKVLSDLMLPSLRLEKLKGDRRGQHSIRINAQYRICFEWHSDGVHNVEIVDYH